MLDLTVPLPMRFCLFTLFLLVSLPMAASVDSIVVDPPSPDSHSSIRIKVFASWCETTSTVSVHGFEIDVDVRGRDSCIDPLPFLPEVDLELGSLPAGTYQIVPSGFTSQETATMIVRDVDAVRIAPYGDRIAGGATIHLTRDGSTFQPSYDPVLAKVTIGGQIARIIRNTGAELVVEAPPHEAGPADVVVTTTDQSGNLVRAYTARSSFFYYDPEAQPDTRVLEPVLFPISFEGPGAAGSHWSTEKVMSSGRNDALSPGGGQINFRLPPCAGCPAEVHDAVRVTGPSRSDGQLVWVVRGGTELSLSSRIHRTDSSGGEDAGTSVPVVRERDFKSYMLLSSVPVKANARTLLRIWSVVPDSRMIITIAGLPHYIVLDPSAISPDGFAFGSVDLTEALTHLPPGTKSVDIAIHTDGRQGLPWRTGAWGMITVTDNHTQEVTVVAP